VSVAETRDFRPARILAQLFDLSPEFRDFPTRLAEFFNVYANKLRSAAASAAPARAQNFLRRDSRILLPRLGDTVYLRAMELATRIRKVRNAIHAEALVELLQDHAFGKVELNLSQVRAIALLLRKSLPDLMSQTERAAPGDRFCVIIEEPRPPREEPAQRGSPPKTEPHLPAPKASAPPPATPPDVDPARMT
jgi:hypothetical protein